VEREHRQLEKEPAQGEQQADLDERLVGGGRKRPQQFVEIDGARGPIEQGESKEPTMKNLRAAATACSRVRRSDTRT
jgi:hypothetical protein